MSEIKWIKLSTDLFNNRKIKQIERLPDGDTLIVIWLKLLILAGETNDSGLVYFTRDIPYTEELLASQFDRPLATVKLALSTFLQFGMIDIAGNVIEVSNWERYQNIEGMERVREQNRLRQQRKRERDKLALSESVTSRDSHAIDKKRIDKNRLDKTRKENTSADGFEAFWSAYPKKLGKGAAEKAFSKALDKTDLQTMLTAIEKQKTTDQWTKEGGKYIPYPSTWLNQERWADEVEEKEALLI